MKTFVLICFYAFVCFKCIFGDIPKIDESVLEKTAAMNKLLLAYITPAKECDDQCQNSLMILNNVVQETSSLGVKAVTVFSKSLLKVFPSPDEPKLFLYRDGIPVMYESEHFDVEEISGWMLDNQEIVLKKLDDGNFEHLTQASSGSTTGDWFILFYSKKCSQFIPVWETLGVRLKHQKIVAIIDTDSSPILKERFSIKKCPYAIFLRHGRIYEYKLQFNDLTSLVNFADGWYNNVPYHKVPVESTPFDNLTTSIAEWLKEHPMVIYITIGSTVFLLLTIVLTNFIFAASKPKSL